MMREEIIEKLRAKINRGREEVKALHRNGGSGLELVRRNAALMDEVCRETYYFSLEQAQRTENNPPDSIALVALGGYGRGELNPQSDVDLLFLYLKRINWFVDFVVKESLHLLWDLGLTVGNSCRSVEDCIRIAKVDSTVRTSMIECRHICGNEDITLELMRAIKKEFLGKRAHDFLKTKAKERGQRHAHYGDSANYLEPNLKEGVGGLRDYHMALWAGIAEYGMRDLDGLAGPGMLTREELHELKQAYDFVHRVRNELHFSVKQRSDVLSIELQKEVANNLGYGNDGVFPGVELFMRDYFLRARDIDRYSRLVLDRCVHKGGIFSSLRKLIGTKEIIKGIYRLGKEITVDGNPFEEQPILILKLFRYCQAKGLKPSQSALRAIRQSLHHLDDELIFRTEAKGLFLEILSEDGASQAIRYMHEASVLGRFIPEFEGLTCLVQRDLYHRYTVDEHLLRALKHLEGLKTTQEPELKELSILFKRVRKPWLLKLAVLFHDIGKSKGTGHIKSGVAMVHEILRRWDIKEEDSERIIFLVKNHLTMNHLVQRRNIRDEKIVANFARTVENEENLSLLYLLTYADIRGVGPNVWTTWKGALLWELYHETHNYFVRGGQAKSSWEDTLVKVKEQVMALVSEKRDAEEVDNYFHSMPYWYLIHTPPEKAVSHLQMVRNLGERTITLNYSHDFQRGYTEIVICTRERPGLFSRIAGTLSAMNINIISAQIYTGTDGMVLDILQVNGVDGKPVLEKERWVKVNNYLTRILEGKLTVEQLMVERKKPLHSKKAEYMELAPMVNLDNSSSDTHTIVEVIAQDRLGLLYAITNTLFTEGANIYLAKITTEAHKAINAFYITDFEGRKIEDEKVLNRLKHRLIAILSNGD